MKITNSFVALSLCITFFMTLFVSLSCLNSIPMETELQHTRTLQVLRVNNFSNESVMECQNENTKITVESDAIYKITTNYKIRIPLLNYEQEKSKISYLYTGI